VNFLHREKKSLEDIQKRIQDFWGTDINDSFRWIARWCFVNGQLCFYLNGREGHVQLQGKYLQIKYPDDGEQ